MAAFLLVLTLIIHSASADPAAFSFHVLSEPNSLDPQLSASPGSSYLLFNLYRGLLKYSEERGLEGEGAKECKRPNPRTVVCELRERKWSNGSPITAADYVAAFRRLVNPDSTSPQADILFNIKNARAIWSKEKTPDTLGVFADSPLKFRVELEQDDPEFEYKLIHPATAPLPPGGYVDRKQASQQVVSGPYMIDEWKSSTWIKLKNNGAFDAGKRPPVEIYFVDEDATAMRLYESGKLNFLRRVTSADMPRVRKSPEFQRIPMARFDYVGFGPQLNGYPKLREALTRSVDFKGFLKLFDTLTPPGCPSLPAKMMDRTPCQEFAPAAAKAAWQSVKNPPKLELHFSMMGGDDIARAAEWFQGQWKKNLGVLVELKSHEQGVYLRLLKNEPPALFRKGIGLDRPTCLAGLEVFTKDHPDNYIRLNDPKYEELVRQAAAVGSISERKVACRKAMEYLNSLHRVIPLGELYFSIMAKPTFKGWSLNSLNHLDLAGLVSTRP